ncbi:MAG: hypothetical protein HF967_03245 [Methanosarcinales archaeon]|nr:hypothetical protein [Methanosarcinales archaeon]
MKFCLNGDDAWKEGILSIENNILSLEEDNKSKKSFEIDIIDIKDLNQSIQNETPIMIIKSKSNENQELLSTSIAMSLDSLNSLQKDLILRLEIFKFDIYFTHAGEGGVLSLEDNINLTKGLLKITESALWIIGKESCARISWENIINAEMKKRSRFKGEEYGAVAIEYFKDDSIESGVISTIVITKGDAITLLKRHIQELLNKYKINEDLHEIEKQILTMVYAGAFEISMGDLENSAEMFDISVSDLESHIDRLTELDIISLNKETGVKVLTKKGIKLVIELTKEGTFGG